MSPRRLFTVWTVLAASLVVSMAVGLGAYVAIRQQVQARFDAWVDDAATRLQGRIAAQEALVRGTAALFSAVRGPVSRAAFREYVARLDLAARYPGVRSVAYVAEVAPAARERFLATMRADHADYPEPPASPDRAAALIAFAEPLDGENRAALGVDLRADPTFAATLEIARDRGVPVLSSRVALPGDRGPPGGYALVFPIYADGELPDDVLARRARLRGFAIASFDAAEFFAAVLGDGELQAPVALRVRDGDADGALVHEDVSEKAWREATLVTARDLDIGGRRWTLEAAGRPSLVAFDELLLPPVIAAGGIVLSLLLFGLLRTLARARATAETTIDALKRGDDARAALLAIERSARQEAQQLVAALERSNRELDQFAYVASHDLKSPLRGIANLSSWIEEDLADAATPETKKNLDLLRGRVRRLENLIDGILSYSRAGRGGEPEEVDVQALAREVVGLLEPAPEATLVVGALPTLSTEKTPLQQVLMNLVANAIKYAGKPDVRIEVAGRETEAGWEFTVADDGPGIAPEYHDKVWQMFQTLHARDHVEATGIGLAVVKKIVESRGGDVRLDSAPGRGTRVTFGWPPRAGSGGPAAGTGAIGAAPGAT